MSDSVRQSLSFRRHAVAVAIFAAILVVVFYRAIFFGEVLASVDLLSKELPWRAVLPNDVKIDNFTSADVFTVFYPWKYFIHSELQAGRFPLWCTHLDCGYPLAGTGNDKLFGLTTLFLWFSSPSTASLLSFFSQLLIGMTGMYALLCAFRFRWSTALFGGVMYGLNSSMFQHLEFEHVVGGLTFLPWMCWVLWEAAQSQLNSRRWLALAGLFWGLAIINGSLQSGAMVWLSAVGFTVAAQWREQRAQWLQRSAVGIMMFSVLGVAVAGVALLPNLELFHLNVRARFEHLDWMGMTWKRPVAMIFWLAAQVNPDLMGNYQTFDLLRVLGRVGADAMTPVMTDLRVYCGLFGLMLALFGLRAKGAPAKMGRILILIPLVLVVLTPVFLIVYFRGIAAASVGVVILAALGLERVWQPDEKMRRDMRLAAGGLIVVLALALLTGSGVTARRESLTRKAEKIGAAGTSFYKADVTWQQHKARQTIQNFSLTGPAVLRFSLLAGFVAMVLVTVKKPSVFVGACFILNTVDLTELAWRTFPCVPQSFAYPSTPALDFLKRQQGMFRVCSSWEPQTELPAARQNLLLPYKLDDPRIYESLTPKNPLLKAADWDTLNVKYFIVPPKSIPPRKDWQRIYSGEVDVYENPSVKPRVYFVLEPDAEPAANVGIEIREYLSGRIKVRVDAPQAGWLVLGERNYPGWHAEVNGHQAQIQEVHGMLQAVPVGVGISEVQSVYKPTSVRAGIWLSLIGLAGVAGTISFQNRRTVVPA